MIDAIAISPPAAATGDLFIQIQHLVARLGTSKHLEDIHHLLSLATGLLGFDHFALLSRGRPVLRSGPQILSDFPPSWGDFLQNWILPTSSPLTLAGRRSSIPFVWKDVGANHVSSSGRSIGHEASMAKLMVDARALGISQGCTIPIHAPGEMMALCSFVATAERGLFNEAMPIAQYLACFAFESVRRVSAASEQEKARLTPRQRQCVVLAARGKSDWASSQILGLAPDTVHKYIEQAKSRMGVCSRTELVVRALHEGQISFEELLC